MKKFTFTIITFLFCGLAFAQKFQPKIKAGTVMSATISVPEGEFNSTITLKSISNPFVLNWAVEGYGDGSFEISDKAIENGNKMFIGQASLGVNKLAESETYAIISRTAFKSLVSSKSFTYNNIKFEVKTKELKAMKIDGKELDAIQVASSNDKIELWILNNPDFPMILQSAGLPVDMIVKEIKE